MWRVFEVTPHEPLLLKTRGDGGMVGDIQFSVSELEDGSWIVKQTIDGPRNFHGLRWFFYTPSSDRIRINARGWFYLYVYRL